MTLALIAASGLAREALEVLRLTRTETDVSILDDDPSLWGSTFAGHDIEGGTDVLGDGRDWQVAICAGQGRSRRSITQRLTSAGRPSGRFATLVHPSVSLPPSCSIGEGSIILAGVVITANATIGEHVVVMPGASLTHDVVIEDFATICAGVALGGNVRVGEAAYLGMNSSVRSGCEVGRDSVLGMGAALVRHLPAGETWAGVPARPLRAATASVNPDRHET